jgi:hypothetical protein
MQLNTMADVAGCKSGTMEVWVIFIFCEMELHEIYALLRDVNSTAVPV